MSVTANAPVPFFTDTRTIAEKLGSDDREWRPHEPEHECPTAIFGLVLERGTYFSRFDKEHHTARVLTADNIVWSLIGFHGWLQSELERKNPQVGDFVGIAFTGTKPARREGESPAFTYRVEVVRNPNPDGAGRAERVTWRRQRRAVPTTPIFRSSRHVELRPARAIRTRTQAGGGSLCEVGEARAGRLRQRPGRRAARALLRVEADLARGTRGARRAGRSPSRGQGRARLRGRERRRPRHRDQVPAARRLLARARRPRTPSTLAAADHRRQARLARLDRRRGRDGRGAAVRARRRRRRRSWCSRPEPARSSASGRRSSRAAHASRSATTPTRTATPGRRRRRRSSAAGRCACARRSKAATGATGTGGREEFLELVRARARAALRVLDARRLPRASVPEGRAAARRAGCDLPRPRVAAHGLRRRRLREVDLDDRRHRAPGRRRRLARHPGAAAGAHLHHRERGPAGPLSAEARGEDRDLGRSRLRAQRVRLRRAVGRVLVRRRRKRARRSSPSARSTRSTSSPPTRRSGSASPLPGRPDETQAFVDWLVECGLKSERAFWLLHHENKAGQISGDWGRHPDTKVSARSRTATSRARSSTGRRRAGRRCRQETSREGVPCSSGSSRRRATASPSSTPSGRPTPSSRSGIVEYLLENPGATTNAVWDGCEGHEQPHPGAARGGAIRLLRGQESEPNCGS